jgi:transposase
LKVSSRAVTKTIKRYDETGSHEDHHRKGRPRVTTAAEDKFIRVNCTSDITAQINASPSSSNRHISTSTVQRGLRESGLHG